jgi:hypothetical protein
MNLSRHLPLGPAVALLAVLAVSPARAQVVVVNYGGNYVASNQTFSPTVLTQTGEFLGADGGHDSRSIVHFSSTTPQISVTGTSGTFYGGYESVNYGTFSPAFTPPVPGYTARQITNSGSTDPIELGTGARDPSTNNGRFAGLLLWQKADFLNGGSGMTLGVDAASTISVSHVAGSGTIFGISVLVRDGNTIYANQSRFNDGSGTYIQGLGPGQSWAIYDPTNDTNTMEFDGPNNRATFTPHAFTNITGVGFTWDLNGFENGGSFPAGGNDFQISAFSATLTPVPEPSSLALAAVATAALTTLRRRGARSIAIEPMPD